MIIPKEDVLKHLAQARELLSDQPSADLHVSPFEVIFHSFAYSPNPFEDGVLSLDHSRYQPPVVGALVTKDDVPQTTPGFRQRDAENMSLFLYRKAFAHIGPRVLGDQMDLSGIKRSLLLPVLHPQSDGKAEMDFVHGLFGGDGRFSLGYCVPNAVPPDGIRRDLERAGENYGIGAVKFNANITGVDLSTAAGRGRLEAILDACQAEGLPAVVHAGRSPVVRNAEAKDFSSLRNLAAIDWGITRRPVILSHGGLMGASLEDIETRLLPELKRILTVHDHVLVDIATLEVPVLRLLLRSLDPERIVFGSDYPYFSQWGTITKLVSALSGISDRIEAPFLKIVAGNAASLLSGDVKC